MTLKELYRDWDEATLGRSKRCPGCQATLMPDQQRVAVRLSVAERRLPLPAVKFCGREECLHVIWDAREVILMQLRKRLDEARYGFEQAGVVFGLGPVPARDWYVPAVAKQCRGDHDEYSPCVAKCFKRDRPSDYRKYPPNGHYWKRYYSMRHRGIFIRQQDRSVSDG